MAQSEKLKQAVKSGQQLVAQGEDADPAEVQAVLRAVIEEDREGFIEAMRNG